MNDSIIAQRLERAGFDTTRVGVRIRAMRRRRIPSGGLWRMLVPRVVCTVVPTPNGPHLTARPEGLAVFMAVMITGGVIVELVADRAQYPREYPAAFPYALFAVYWALLVFELVFSHRAAARAVTTN